jgi:hypothetical protein
VNDPAATIADALTVTLGIVSAARLEHAVPATGGRATCASPGTVVTNRHASTYRFIAASELAGWYTEKSGLATK